MAVLTVLTVLMYI